MKRGDIILVKFPFSDYTTEKLRPALVLSSNNSRDVCVAFISSVIPLKLEETDQLVFRKNPGFEKMGLKKDSIFRMGKLATLDKMIILGKLG
ncbi:type II toxin-antitoxin system PemK/MazF family toxin [Candidatus Woesearchaeota archaeon]|nr:type II toxin-antitoxin system PemK/MazF family toxin [Candidatus Woesearchaeota archaeon]